MSKRRTWAERLADDKNLPLNKPIPAKMVKRSGPGTMVAPSAREVDAAIQAVRKRKLATARKIAARIARKHGTTVCCPVTTGIFSVAAHAAHEAELTGKKRVTPYWRVLKNGGELNAKYPGDIAEVKRRLEEEGHVVLRQGQRYFVKDYEAKLAAL
jgi:hypothetical protein